MLTRSCYIFVPTTPKVFDIGFPVFRIRSDMWVFSLIYDDRYGVGGIEARQLALRVPAHSDDQKDHRSQVDESHRHQISGGCTCS